MSIDKLYQFKIDSKAFVRIHYFTFISKFKIILNIARISQFMNNSMHFYSKTLKKKLKKMFLQTVGYYKPTGLWSHIHASWLLLIKFIFIYIVLFAVVVCGWMFWVDWKLQLKFSSILFKCYVNVRKRLGVGWLNFYY